MRLFLKNGPEKACCFARTEFEKYAYRTFQDVETISDGEELYIGLPREEDVEAVTCSDTVDTIFIEVKAGKGRILGSNPCTVLIAVYRFFRECGCRFLRPGPQGEYIPRCLISNTNVSVAETASSNIRGIIIEGACSYENVFDVIDFSPKIGLNCYRFQFRESFVFFERWYDHLGNPKKEGKNISIEQVTEMVKNLRAEVKKRGMKLHTMGHGWTTDPIGFPSTGWHEWNQEVPEETRALLAEVNGVRELNNNVPLKTHLCYSNPVVQDKIIDYMVQYCKENPDSDCIHFGLADSLNHSCECENCNPYRLSDLMVRLLNRADERLTKEKIKHRIVFGAYADRLWAPIVERVKNPDRFRLQFSPVSRPYHISCQLDGIPDTEPEPYVTNKLILPKTYKENISYLKSWQKVYNGSCFLGGYHYMWAHYADIGYQQIARVLYDDICRLKELKMDGMLMFQVQRCAIPTAMGFYTYGNALWDNTVSFEELSKDYFSHAFGQGWEDCLDYLQKLSDRFDMKLKREDRDYRIQDCLQVFEECLSIVWKFQQAYSNRMPYEDETQELSWHYLEVYNQYLVKLLQALIVAAKGRIKEGRQMLLDLIAWMYDQEDNIQAGWDNMIYEKRILVFFDDLVTGQGERILHT